MKYTRKLDNYTLLEREFYVSFDDLQVPGKSFAFPCDSSWVIDPITLSPTAYANLRMCEECPQRYIMRTEYRDRHINLCMCGSGEIPENNYDARGYYIGKACRKCKGELLEKFRRECLTNPNYDEEGY